MSDPELDFAALNRYKQTLVHLLIDMGRIKSEPRYEVKEGGYGDVGVATLDPGASTPRLVTARTIRLKDRDKPPERLAFRLVRELSVWARLQHPHVLPLVGYFLDQDNKFGVFISDYMTHGDLMEYIKQEKPSLDIRLQLICDSTDGLAYLHGQNPPICHGDLKTKNVLINGELQAMLADFGLSKALDDEPTGPTTSDDLKGTLRYYSPEVMSGSDRNLASDIWAWGCLVLEVLTDKLPYETKRTEKGIIMALVMNELPSDPESLPITVPDVKVLLAKCWNLQPNERPSAAYCLRILNSVSPASNDGRQVEEAASQQNPTQAGSWPIELSTNVTTFGSASLPQDNAGGDFQPNVEESKVEDAMDVTEDDLDLRNSVEPIRAVSQPRINWSKGRLISLGDYVPIHFALNVTTGEQMAVKEVEMVRYQRPRDYLRLVRIVKALETEQRTLQKLDHPNVVQYLGSQKSEEFFRIFFEYVPGGSIGSCLRSYGKMKENTIKSFAGQIANGLAYLHTNKIIHGNIKAENVFLDYSGQCKIGEFTRSQEREEIYQTALMKPIRGSVFWTAPEMLPGNLKGYSAKVDMWSFGCTVLAMLSGKRPWPEADEVDVLNNIGRNAMVPPVPANVHRSTGAEDFLLKCLTEDQDERPSAEALKTHPWLTLPDGWMFTGFH